MNKIIIIISCLFTALFSQAQITYTPQTAAGYQFKYVKSDSGFALPFIDTSLRRGVNRIGAVVARPQDSLLYYWTGAKWSKINADVSGLISLINSKVDSVTVYGNDLKYWINGVAVQYSLNTYLGNLQTVTNNGNTTTNDIQVNRLQANAAITATQINASDYLFRTLTNNAFADSLRGYIKGDSLTHNNLNWYLPDTTGTFVLRINGVAPDKNGNVTGLFGGGSGSLDTTTIYNNLALKLNIADTADMLNAYVNDAYNGLQKLGQKIGLGGTLNQHTTFTDNDLYRINWTDPQYFRVTKPSYNGVFDIGRGTSTIQGNKLNLIGNDSVMLSSLNTSTSTNNLIGLQSNGKMTNVFLGSGLAMLSGVLTNTAPLGTDTATTTGFGLTKNVAGNVINLKVDTSVIATPHDLTAKQNTLTLTTTGTSGPATLISDVLNIPQYSGGGAETDPVFTAHTTNNIVNGTGFLKNNGSGTWSYDGSTYLTTTGSGASLTGVLHTTGNESASGLKTLTNKLTLETSTAGSVTNMLGMEYSSSSVGTGISSQFTTIGGIEVGGFTHQRTAVGSYEFYINNWDGVSNSEAIRIKSFAAAGSNSVGIGGVSPTAKLHVLGTVRLQTGNEGAGKILQSDASGNADWVTPNFLASSNFVYNEEFTGSTSSTYTLANTPITGKLVVFKNGLKLPNSEFSLSGTTVTLTSARLITDVFSNDYIK